MRGRTIIKRDGTIVTEVIDREGSDCKQVYRVTEHLGSQTGEDVTGPDCDATHEIAVDE